MGASKTEQFSPTQNKMALLAKALAHPARIAILEYLVKTDACICGDIVNVLPLAQPTVSQHLKELKNAGLIQGSVEGTSICYCVNHDTLNELRAFIDQIAQEKQTNGSSCCN